MGKSEPRWHRRIGIVAGRLAPPAKNPDDSSMEVYDTKGQTLGMLAFEGDLVQGVVHRADIAEARDVAYSFLGTYVPDDVIGHVILKENVSLFDDLNVGIIPEPTTALLVLVSGTTLLRQRLLNSAA